MMRTLDARPLGLLGALLAGAAVALAVMAAAGSGPALWVAVAGASACACGLVVGTTARVVPAVALAGVAAVALVLAVDGYRDPAPTEVRAYRTLDLATPHAARATHVENVETPAPPPPLTKPQFVQRFYAALDAGRYAQAWERLGPAVRARSASFEAWRAGDAYRAPAPTEVRAYKTLPVAAPHAARVTHVKNVETPARPPLTKPQFVHRFYAALDAGRYAQAWERLGPVVRARSASFEAWRAGYATTLSQRVEDLRVEADGNVRHTLVTVDRTPCGGTTERRYEMLWYLDEDGRTFTARDLVGVQLAGVEPALACD
jgi:hypothetical protein